MKGRCFAGSLDSGWPLETFRALAFRDEALHNFIFPRDIFGPSAARVGYD
jgi:hypothetical protein